MPVFLPIFSPLHSARPKRRPHSLRLLALLPLAAALLCGGARASGGGEMSTLVATSRIQPEKAALPKYMDGHLGVLWPGYAAPYLLLAYRQMLGLPPLSDEDRSSLLAGKLVQADDYTRTQAAIKAWMQARAKAGVVQSVEVRPGERNTMDFTYAPNCGAAAFETAAATLARRSADHADAQQWVSTWIAGQDAVFATCSAGKGAAQPALPALASGAPQWLERDRRYQLASMQFYGGDYDAAGKSFTEIAADAGSPWREWASYLVARNWRRQLLVDTARARDTLGGDWSGHPMAVRLHTLASKARDPAVRAAAADMIDMIESRVVPGEVWQRRWQAMDGRQPPASLQQWSSDIRWLWALMPAAGYADDWLYLTGTLSTDSIFAEPERIARSQQLVFERWQRTRALPWLASAVMVALPGQPHTAQLVKDSRALPQSSPLYLHFAWHRARLALMALRYDEVRAELTRAAPLLPEEGLGTRQLFGSLAMRAALSLDGVAQNFPRTPLGFDAYYGSRGFTEDLPKGSDKGLLDQDTQDWLYSQFTAVELLRLGTGGEAGATAAVPPTPAASVAASPPLARGLKVRLLSEAWQRAAMTGQAAVAAEALRAWQAESDSRNLQAAVQAADPAEQRYLLARMMLLKEVPGLGRAEWMQRSYYSQAMFTDGKAGFKPLSQVPPAFHDAAAARDAAAQLKRYQDLSTTEWMGRQILPYISANPRLPEGATVLARLVRQSRYGERHTPTSRSAFTLLHKLYAKSPEAADTRYFY